MEAHTPAIRTTQGVEAAFLPDSFPRLDCAEARWYAAYTCANHEKRVAEQLEGRTVEHFLPSYASVRRWKDRRVKLDLPLFPGYVFVHIALRDRLQVLQLSGVVRLVGFNGTPTAMPDDEMAALREGLSRQLRVEPHPYLTVGRRVRIIAGTFQGLEGILLRRRGRFRVVLSLELIRRSIVAEVDAADVQPLSGARKLQISRKGDTHPEEGLEIRGGRGCKP